MKFTKIPPTAFQNIQLNAGILATGFNPVTGEVTGQLGATTGGIQFNAAPSFTDFGDDIDNCPKNMMELKKLDSWEVSMSGTFVTVNTATAKKLIAAADIDSNDATHIVPRVDLASDLSDFQDLWWIGDYSDKNGDTDPDAGYLAIHMLNALNTGGFQIQSSDKGKGNFAFTFTGHVSMSAQTVVPFEVYIKGGSTEEPYIVLNTHTLNLVTNQEVNLTYVVNPSDASVTFDSDSDEVATITSAGKVKGIAAGNTIISASIQPVSQGPIYKDTCTVIVTQPAG